MASDTGCPGDGKSGTEQPEGDKDTITGTGRWYFYFLDETTVKGLGSDASGGSSLCHCTGVEKEREKAAGRKTTPEKAAAGISTAGGAAGSADRIRNDDPPGMGTHFVDGTENAEGTWRSGTFVPDGDAENASGDTERLRRERSI